MFCAIIVGGVAVIFLLANGFRRYDGGIPLVGNCSAAISAACHPARGDSEPWEKSLMWGAVSEGESGGEGHTVGHCCFSNSNVHTPVEGNYYAGIGVEESALTTSVGSGQG